MNIKGFTPFIDRVYEHYLAAGQSEAEARITTLVFGAVYRYSNMKKRYCNASRETLARKVGVSKKTVDRRLPLLCEDGFLEDLTPDKKNEPHVYIPTEMAEIIITLEVGQGVPPNDLVGQGVPAGGTGSPSRWDRESLEETRGNNKETNMSPSQEKESSLNEFFPRLALPAESNGQEQQGLKQPRDPFAPFHAVASRNEEKSFDPKQHPAYQAFEAIRPAYEGPELEKNFYHCRDACGFDGDQAWLAAAFLTFTGLPTSALTGAGKIARDTRKMWRDEMDVYLAVDPLPKVLSYYHYAVEEMVEDGLSINSPRSIRNKVAEIIARSKRANGGERYVARQKV